MNNNIKNWGSRLKGIFKIISFVGFQKALNLFFCWGLYATTQFKHGIEKYDKKRIILIEEWLLQKYEELIPETFAKTNPPLISKKIKETIWVFWYQGEELMPEAVKLCYTSICNHSNGHPVILLSKNNIAEYVKLPSFVFKKVEKGLISYTHFSDALRLNLLYNHGGLWMDSTLFITSPIDTKTYSGLFHSIKNIPLKKGTISEYRWATFYLYCRKGSPAFKVLNNLFLSYLESNISIIDYFLIDYFFDLLYKKNELFKKTVDHIPNSNPGLHILTYELNKPFDAILFEKFKNYSTVFKFNRRSHYIKEINNKTTLYGHLVQKYL